MISLEFSEQDLADIDEACDDPTLPEKLKRKLMCLRMHQQKVRNGVIASVINISRNTVTSYLKETQTRQTLHKMGLKYRKTGVIPGKANPQLQFDFFKNELSPRLEEAGKDQRKACFVDAAHFVLGSFLGMIWCFSRIFIKSGCGRQRYNVLGALDSHSKEVMTVRRTDNINSFSVCELIDKIKLANEDRNVTLVMDNARYQRCHKVTEHAAIQGIY